MIELLSKEFLKEWSGYRSPSRITEWLRENSIRFMIGADGWPRVMSVDVFPVTKTLKRSEPNIAALKELQNGKAKKVSTRPA